MTRGSRRGPRVVVLGIAAQYPLAGVTWQALQYLVGLQRLGCDVFYVEDSGAPPYDPARDTIGTDARANVAHLAAAMRRIDLTEHWSYWDALTDSWHGLARGVVAELYASADLIVNLCGATKPREEHRRGARLCYVETDPVYEQMRVANGETDSIEFLAAHDVLFTYGELLGTPACAVPVDRFRWIPTRPPVVLECWPGEPPRPDAGAPRGWFRSIATWENKGKNVTFHGETYWWSKHVNFVRMLDVPRRSGEAFELAMDPLDDAVRADLVGHGWSLVDPRPISADLDAYRAYVGQARAEFTVAKDIYVRPRSGWFSDRSVCFLAAGKPVVTQDTGFSTFIPTGRGLLAFDDADGAVAAVQGVAADYATHAAEARAIAAEYFAAERVLGALLAAAA